MEEGRIVKAPDGKKIYITIGQPDSPSHGMVVFVHGLASTELWPPMLLGSWYFRKRGFAYSRINLYDWRPGARTLRTSDLLQHAADVETVARYLRRTTAEPLFAVGHSFGGLTLLATNQSLFSALSLWDCSSFISHPPRSWFGRDRSSGATFIRGASELLLSKRYQRGMLTFPNELDLAAALRIPTQICYAGGPGSMLIESSKRYYNTLTCTKAIVEVPGATHSFTEEGVSNILFRRTIEWFKRSQREHVSKEKAPQKP